MKVLVTIPGLSAKSGGPSTCTLDMMEGLWDVTHPGLMQQSCGSSGSKVLGECRVDLLTVSSNDILGKGRPWLKDVPNDYRTPFVISRNIQKYLRQSDYDIYHANALWMGSTHDTCRIARKLGKPYVLSPHGMLYPTALAVKSWKKKILLNLWYNKDIMEATCLHATCQQEAEYCRQFGYKGPIAVIPNAVVFPKGVEIKEKIYKDQKGRRQIGFLGRLHPIKKVENIIYAIDMLSDELKSQLSFQIMGKYDDDYEQWLKDEVNRLHLENCVEFVGFVSGKEKFDRLTKLAALMVPSAQENFGMIVPEALICGTPVYASLGTPWGELNDCNAGWWKDNTPKTIAGVIMEILSKSDEELLVMGINGCHLIEEKYEQHKVAGMMKRLYEWIADDNMNNYTTPNYIYWD